ncbi:uncharacterized protein METZ01_LOCUS126719 [marine metagenome]|uniref:Uncharacterized protein n=1 Tax=marine metagenome TaxID=408172 RepID=A0A381YA40_9ZZZZ
MVPRAGIDKPAVCGLSSVGSIAPSSLIITVANPILKS